MAGCRRGLVVMPGMGHGQRLQDPADGLSGGGLQDQMEMVVHQAISVESKGIALLGLGQGLEELVEVGIVEEDAGAVVATVEGVINQAIRHQSRLSSHASSLTSSQSEGKSKNELTPIFLAAANGPAFGSGEHAQAAGPPAEGQAGNARQRHSV